MKKENVPQDDLFSHDGKFKEITYAVGEDGNFEQVLSVGCQPKNAALKQAWDAANEQVLEVAEQVVAGELSPIAYYMEKNLMDLKVLSQYVEFPKRKVKKHLLPKGFQKLDTAQLQKYADLFRISIETLKDLTPIKAELEEHED